MKIGFIGFGEVSFTIASILLKNKSKNKANVELYSCSENRSEKTKQLMKSIGIKDLKTIENLFKVVDIIISANSPVSALKIAKTYDKNIKKIFIDFNNISPETTNKISNIIGNNFIKGSIIGNIKSKEHIIYLSGEKSEKIEILKDYGLNIKIVGKSPEIASKIKILRSIYTKGVSALLVETLNIAKSMNLEETTLNTIAIGECNNFKTKAISRKENSLKNAKRKYEEMCEILEYLNGFKDNSYEDIDYTMIKSIAKKFKYLNKNYEN
ncbi:MAG: NAD(P)-binding domain-containing protein [Methanobrevibacter sp.]|jgi:3-hydroxyisobutyrate dehydrogenase-like beta-hydroxyacid dehydrogenase|nr:NAD(P)-binding domain-containing protein [Candidatus Methanoflexus mossambicus]